MNRYQFLGALQDQLEKSLSKEELNPVMEYYENYIIEAMDYGKEEQDVLNELGTPVDLAKTILTNLKAEGDIEMKEEAEKVTANQSYQDVEVPNDVDVPNLNTIFNDFMKDTTQSINEAAGKISDYFTDMFASENFFEDSDDLASDHELIDTIEQEKEIALTDFEEVNFKAKNTPVYAGFTNDEALKVCIKGNLKFNLYKNGNTLMVKRMHQKIYSRNEEKNCVYVYLPLTYKGHFKIDCDNGLIEFDGDGKKYPSPITINCDNAAVKIKDAILGKLNVSCDNGKITLKHIICYKATLKCDNGMIKYDMWKNDYAKNIRLKADNGIIKINDRKLVIGHGGHYCTVIPAKNDSKYELSVDAECANGMIRLTGF